MQITFYEQFMKQADSFKIPPADYNPLLKPVYEGEIKGDFSPLAPVLGSFAAITSCRGLSFRDSGKQVLLVMCWAVFEPKCCLHSSM